MFEPSPISIELISPRNTQPYHTLLSAPSVTLPSTVAFALAGERRATDRRMLELLAPYAGQRFRVIRWLFADAVARELPWRPGRSDRV